jgi:toxin ParE1/3/4
MKPSVMDVEAKAEFDGDIALYEQQRPGLGAEFREEILRVIDEIRKNPYLGGQYKRTEFRHFPIQRFPYVIYYGDLVEVIWIIAIAHGSRRQGYWKKRLSRRP